MAIIVPLVFSSPRQIPTYVQQSFCERVMILPDRVIDDVASHADIDEVYTQVKPERGSSLRQRCF
jgi:hypothetical protein